MSAKYTEQQLDALRELANIGSGTAGTALSSILGRPVDISVPSVGAMELEDAVEAVGDPSQEVRATLVPIKGDLQGSALLIFPPEDAVKLCGMLGVDAEGEDGQSFLAGIFISRLDLLGAIVATVLLGQGESEGALLLDSDLVVEGESCGLSFLLLPAGNGISDVLQRLGL